MQELYEQYKGLLYKLAYQLTGSSADAEDAVQDVFLKLHDVNPQRLAEPKAYLCKMVTNRCLDLLKSARKRREQYFGPWLPEPVLASTDHTLESAVQSELLSYAVLVLMERLSPAERAAFVLREAFQLEYADIADAIGKSEWNCRKLVSRAREKMGFAQEEPIRAETASREWVLRFLSALETGRVDAVVSLLAEDAVLISDGGGKAVAAVRPLETRERVAAFLLGLFRQAPQFEGGVETEIREINGQAGLLIRSAGRIETVVLMHADDRLVRRVFFIRNPDKLRLAGLW